jgi:hypothetical protein
MTATLLDAETRARLRSKAEAIESLVGKRDDERPVAADKLDWRADRRMAWYRGVEDAVLDLANALPAGTEDYDALQLFRFLTELRRAIDEDADVRDEAGRVSLAATRMRDVLRRLERRLEHSLLDDPDAAARYVFTQLDSIPATALAQMLGVSTKTIGAWRSGKPVKQRTERVKLVAALVFYLRHTMTQTGVLMWFEDEADLLDGRSPLAMMDESVASAWAPLVANARGGRGQLAG